MRKDSQSHQSKSTPCPGRVFSDGSILELLYDPASEETKFAIWDGDRWEIVPEYVTDTLETLVPYSAKNNLVSNEVIVLPSAVEEYGTNEDLITEIRAFIHKYVDLSSRFETIASYYVLFSWVYDSFNEVPYLRLRGDWGSGKTRFLLTVGSLCYKAIFASGASTVSPIFHILDRFGGTLIIDEGDFRFSDEKADIVKILNNGNVRGIPILRQEISPTKELNPRAFHVFGPKIVATRGYYDDRALESRFITEEMGTGTLRSDIPINLPPSYKEEARKLRNKLLLFRFRNFGKKLPEESLVDRSLEPRMNQIFVPLMCIVSDAKLRKELHDLAREYSDEVVVDRGMDTEARVLEVINELLSGADQKQLSIKEITHLFSERFGDEYQRMITAKWIGSVIRRKLKLKTKKSHGVFIIPPTEAPKLKLLYGRYGIEPTERQTSLLPVEEKEEKQAG